jgi:23S rRNA G2445 N2-methylase RlmL
VSAPAAKPRERFFVTCAPGLEPLLHEEVKQLGLSKVERQVGGVYFEGSMRDAWRANLWLRTAVRVLMRLARFEATTSDELYDGVKSVEWSRFLRPEGSLAVDAHTSDSELDHTLFLAQRAKDAIVDALRTGGGIRPEVDKDNPDLSVYLHVFRNRVTVLVDTSGDSLHKRGWRKFQGRAPLSETLGAALVMLSGWDRRAPLVDPFCGSGTVLIEAALLASNIAPGQFRERFGFERWLGHDAASWRKLREEARAQAKPAPKLILRGRDWDPASVSGALENAASAGVAERIEFDVGNGLEFDFKRGWNAWIVSNLPYGERVADQRAAQVLHRTLGERLRAKCGGYHYGLLGLRDQLASTLALPGAAVTPVLNGGLECELVTGEVPRTSA